MSKYDEIKSEHRGEFIAIFDGGDIIGDTSREVLLGKIRQKVEHKDLDSVFQTYISKTDDIIWWFFYETILMSDRLCLFVLSIDLIRFSYTIEVDS